MQELPEQQRPKQQQEVLQEAPAKKLYDEQTLQEVVVEAILDKVGESEMSLKYWEVVASEGVNVWAAADFHSPVLFGLGMGDVVRGRQAGDWVTLPDMSGFTRTKGIELLFK